MSRGTYSTRVKKTVGLFLLVGVLGLASMGMAYAQATPTPEPLEQPEVCYTYDDHGNCTDHLGFVTPAPLSIVDD